ncbi:MAG: hypothetical protein GY696_11260 [Gammaproteobacteria bacterium]|nr:hypothetical protein [Gammaproteobacteria bacterium]
MKRTTTFSYNLSGTDRRDDNPERRAVTRGVEPCPQRGGIALSNRKRRGEELRNNASPLESAVEVLFFVKSDERK